MNRRQFGKHLAVGGGAALAATAVTAADEPAAEKLDLWKSYGTTGQKDIHEASAGFNIGKEGEQKYIEPYGATLARIKSDFGNGASNAFLVHGKDITGAIEATASVLLGGQSAERPGVNARGQMPPSLWLVAYLGSSGSSPPEWTVRSVERRGNSFRVSYSTRQAETDDGRHYFVWVPVGELKPGTYSLELFDVGRKEVMLLRRVVVPAK